jgi:hypothetical protein
MIPRSILNHQPMRKTLMSEQAEYTYDGFFSYSHLDRVWVWDELSPRTPTPKLTQEGSQG